MEKTSPRIEDGIIKWYCGDAFFIDFEIMDDEAGKALELSENDGVVITFYNRQLIAVKKFEFKGGMSCNCLSCHIDKDTTKFFTAGKYTYAIRYCKNNCETMQTVKAVGECEVERCH